LTKENLTDEHAQTFSHRSKEEGGRTIESSGEPSLVGKKEGKKKLNPRNQREKINYRGKKRREKKKN